ncbi:MAG TPA: type 1 glutamine amidotransferase [Pirellulales bacterium]|jgi:GMP synthase-like glutamine amidotransferase|nr:type 1 glutamine amidotransferase [Pirellulales bacterium]
MRVHHLQHVPFEGLGSIEPWLLEAGHRVSRTRQFAGERPPSVDDFDWLIVMGGPMGANDDAKLTWMTPEKALIRQAIDAGKRVLGVCLGAQLLAAVLGAKVFKNVEREIGWFDVERAPDATKHRLGEVLPKRAEVFHWHGDTFDLPKGATLLASSIACRNQAFALGDKVLALQFHLEMTPDLAAALVDHCADELEPRPYIQTGEQMLAVPERFARGNAMMNKVLEVLAA